MFRKFDRFTDRSRRLMYVANALAIQMGDDEISAGNVLLAMIDERMEIGMGRWVIMRRGVDIEKLRSCLCTRLSTGEKRVTMQKLPQSKYAQDVIRAAIEESRAIGDDYVGTEHLLLGLALSRETGPILESCGGTHKWLRAGVELAKAERKHAEGDVRGAVAVYERLAGEHAKDVEAMNDLAWALATYEEVLNPSRAVDIATKVCELTEFKNFACVDTLAAAYAAAGKFREAVSWQEQVVAKEPERKYRVDRLAFYREGKVWREPWTRRKD